MNITVESKAKDDKSPTDLSLDKNKFTVDIDDILSQKWTNAEEGLIYSFQLELQLKLKAITYIPKKSDNHLRCEGFPPYSPETQYFTMLTTRFSNSELSKKDRLNMILGYVDIFIVNAMESPDYKSYVLVYFDKKHSFNEYQKRLNKVKDHIFNRRKISTERITVIEDGLREDAVIEFYTLPKEAKPPTPNPTLPSPQFMKKQ